MKPTRFFALGGMQEIGKTTLVVEYDQEIVIIDAGIKFTNSIETGVDGIIPDYTYLANNEHKIKGLFITHGHEDHIGGIPYLITQVDIKRIYAPLFAIELIKERLRDKKIQTEVEFIEIKRDLVFKFENIAVDFWTSQHSIPDSFGIRVKTPNGSIMDTGDFRFDYTPIGNLTDFSKLEEWAKDGIDIFISDSTNSMSPDHSPSEANILVDIENIIKETKGKLLFSTFASNMNRVKAVIDMAQRNGRRVCAFGRSMIKVIDIAKKIKFIDVPESVFVDKREISNLEDKEVLILSTGSQGEELAALTQIAQGRQKWVQLTDQDVVILSSSAIPGNAMKIELLINQLYKAKADVKENKIDGMLHTSGHAYKDEHLKIFNIVKPKYFIPYHGAYRQSAVHGYTATQTGMSKDNVFIIENGDVVELRNHVVTQTKEKIDHGPIYIDSKVASRATGEVIAIRETLGSNGFINIIVTIDKAKNEIVGRTKIISRGALYVKESADIISQIQKISHGTVLYIIKNNPKWTKKDIKDSIKSRVKPFFYKLKRRNPVIVVTIMELDKKTQLTNLKKKPVNNNDTNKTKEKPKPKVQNKPKNTKVKNDAPKVKNHQKPNAQQNKNKPQKHKPKHQINKKPRPKKIIKKNPSSAKSKPTKIKS